MKFPWLCPLLLFCASLLVLLHQWVPTAKAIGGLQVWRRKEEEEEEALFVFGDSYADTGNHEKDEEGSPWSPPYGLTWPTHPSGRFSDGRLLTDLIASFLNLPLPFTYRERKLHSKEKLHAGMNFAFGGSGVFPTFGPKYTTIVGQISQFKNMIESGIYNKKLVGKSMALIVYAGNDYSAKNPPYEGIKPLVEQVVQEITRVVLQLHHLGIRKFMVTNMEPYGCLPFRAVNHNLCNNTMNEISLLHNQALNASISSTINGLANNSLLVLDMYRSFLEVLHDESVSDPLKPCCNGTSICKNPKDHIFWDLGHPSQAGWLRIFQHLKYAIQHFMLKP